MSERVAGEGERVWQYGHPFSSSILRRWLNAIAPSGLSSDTDMIAVILSRSGVGPFVPKVGSDSHANAVSSSAEIEPVFPGMQINRPS